MMSPIGWTYNEKSSGPMTERLIEIRNLYLSVPDTLTPDNYSLSVRMSTCTPQRQISLRCVLLGVDSSPKNCCQSVAE